jgi:hypothetical protein
MPPPPSGRRITCLGLECKRRSRRGKARLNLGMDRIHYAGDSILTGTEIAHALLEYAQALAVAGTSATVDIPVVDERDGSIGRSELLIGPASQLISDTEQSPYEDVIDHDLVTRMHDEAARLRRHGAHVPSAVTGSDDGEAVPDFDL